MTRSTILLSLMALITVGGCNAPTETIESTPGASSQQPVEQSVDSADDSAPASPPDSVSQPLESSDESPSIIAKTESNAADPPASATAPAPPTAPAKAPTAPEPGSEADAAETSGPDNGGSGVTVQSAQPGAGDTAIIPGQQFSFVTQNTTYEQLETEIGASQLTTEEVHLGEGFFAPATRVNGDSRQSFTVVWSDESKSTPLEVRELGTGWKINGIHNGMSFEELEAALGEFALLGFGWDYGGTLLLENTALAPYSGKLFIRVQPSEKAMEGQQEKFTAVLGDGSFASSNPNFDALDLSVIELVVRLDQ